MTNIQKTWLIRSAFEFVIRLFTGFIAIHSISKKIMSPHIPVISIFKFLTSVPHKAMLDAGSNLHADTSFSGPFVVQGRILRFGACASHDIRLYLKKKLTS